GFGTAGRAVSKRVINLKSLIAKSQNNRLSELFDDIGQWKDISMPEAFLVQNRIKSSEAYEVLLSTTTKKRYELKNLKTKELSVPHGVYDFVNPSSAPGRIYVMKYHRINQEKYIGHTSLTRSKGRAAPVRYAGMMGFEKGKLIYWNNLSGHYRPPCDLSYSNLIPWARRMLPEDKFQTNLI
ncbi:TPA: RHS repeat-associated core domain-containing protein, partial [Enterobacter cloacae]